MITNNYEYNLEKLATVAYGKRAFSDPAVCGQVNNVLLTLSG